MKNVNLLNSVSESLFSEISELEDKLNKDSQFKELLTIVFGENMYAQLNLTNDIYEIPEEKRYKIRLPNDYNTNTDIYLKYTNNNFKICWNHQIQGYQQTFKECLKEKTVTDKIKMLSSIQFLLEAIENKPLNALLDQFIGKQLEKYLFNVKQEDKKWQKENDFDDGL